MITTGEIVYLATQRGYNLNNRTTRVTIAPLGSSLALKHACCYLLRLWHDL